MSEVLKIYHILRIRQTIAKEYSSLTKTEIVRSFKLTLCYQMDFPIHIDTICMGSPILYLKGSQVEVSDL